MAASMHSVPCCPGYWITFTTELPALTTGLETRGTRFGDGY